MVSSHWKDHSLVCNIDFKYDNYIEHAKSMFASLASLGMSVELPVTLFLFGYELSLTINCVKLMDGLVTGCLSGQSVCCSCSSWKKKILYSEASYRYYHIQSIRKSPLEKIHTFLLQSVIENGRSASPPPS